MHTFAVVLLRHFPVLQIQRHCDAGRANDNTVDVMIGMLSYLVIRSIRPTGEQEQT